MSEDSDVLISIMTICETKLAYRDRRWARLHSICGCACVCGRTDTVNDMQWQRTHTQSPHTDTRALIMKQLGDNLVRDRCTSKISEVNWMKQNNLWLTLLGW